MKIRIILFSIVFLFSSSFTYAYDEVDIQNIDIDTGEIMEAIKGETLPMLIQILDWFKVNIWPDIEETIDKLLTPERREELERETEEVKQELPGVIQYFVNLFEKIKEKE